MTAAFSTKLPDAAVLSHAIFHFLLSSCVASLCGVAQLLLSTPERAAFQQKTKQLLFFKHVKFPGSKELLLFCLI